MLFYASDLQIRPSQFTIKSFAWSNLQYAAFIGLDFSALAAFA